MSAEAPGRAAARPGIARRMPRFLRSRSGQLGLMLATTMVGVAVLGPFAAPHGPSELLGVPFSQPSGTYPMGTDFLGRDVLSRILWGGRSVLVFALVATIVAYVLGGAVGLLAGYRRGRLDAVLMRAMDVLLAFPPILLLLVLATGAGPSPSAVIVGIAAIHLPSIARLVRIATLEVAVRGYVEAAVARGERLGRVLLREIVPNIWSPIIADAGPRFTISVLLVAALNFLGLGLRPPAADWAVMISENRAALTLTPWTISLSVFVPAVLIALLTISVNLVGDAIARSLGRSVDDVLTR